MPEDGSLDLRAEEHPEHSSEKYRTKLSNRAARRIWRTQEGVDIPYEKLEDGHLVNILMMCRRRSQESAQCGASKRGLKLLEDGWMLRKHPQWDSLVEEARRRGGYLDPFIDIIDSDRPINEKVIRDAIPRDRRGPSQGFRFRSKTSTV